MRTNLVAIALLAVWSGCALGETYVVTKLGVLPTGFSPFTGKGPSITSSGQASGFIEVEGNSLAAIGIAGGGVTTIGTPGSAFSFATGISKSGDAVGYQSLAGSTTDYHAFFYSGGRLIDMGTLGGETSDALAVSDTNLATGESLTTVGARTAFFWNGSSMLIIPTPNGEESIGMGISDNGFVTGLVGSPSSNGGIVNYQAFLWRNGREMVMLGGDNSTGNAVNNKGVVAGVSYYGSQYLATIWSASGTMVNLGGSNSVANAINNDGVVAGTNDSTTKEHAYVWSKGVGTDLGRLLGPRVTSTAWNVDGSGGVIGITSGNEVIMWTPVPVALASLLTDVKRVALYKDLSISLLSAEIFYDAQDIAATCAVLTDFVNEAQAAYETAIRQQLPTQLIARADAIATALGCKPRLPN